MSIRIVTHCYARELPQYARFLQCQLSSFVLYPPNVPIKIHVFLTPEDARTHRVIDWFCDYTPLSLSLTYLPAGQLWRRSIGRNIAAKQAEEELVWFTDVDHLFGDGCLDALWQTWAAMPQEQKDSISLLYSRSLQIHRSHAIGDAYCDSDVLGLIPIRPEQYKLRTYTRAIGGVQIVPKVFCRKHGYLDHAHKWMRPASHPFGDFRDDVAFRKFCFRNGKVQRVLLPNLFRMRHTEITYRKRKVENKE